MLRIYAVVFLLITLVFAEEKKWDVSADHGPTTTTSFQTDEGTWMNLDVSPDGKQLVFDLMGDIYLMPVSGGKAEVLRGGPAYEVQPRFSPDGKQISFTSDHDGGDNIWVMNIDGSEARPVSKESFRLLNNAVWTPDGQYLVARKHFTSGRSLGAGEMWMYHISGGSGLQLTKRPNDQKDVGEPCLSPDGRYLFFSQDMTPGNRFDYNKDPNGQIYVIRRLDLQSGDLKNIITGNGSAFRPQVSPDGKLIAFVRRVRTKTVLYLYDRKNGESWPLYDGLSKDQQETWAIFGVYPNFQWLPDSKSIVFWAKGKIHRIAIQSKKVTDIPFTATVQQHISQAVRFKQQISADEFDVKMIRQAVSSPNGKYLVFHGAGHLWIKRMPDGKPQRLTNSKHFEYEPSFSPSGNWVVYTAWDDEQMGAVYKIRTNGKSMTKLTAEKGFYFEPSFSPDGKYIVYRRGGGNFVIGNSHAVNRGLYIMTASGKQPYLVCEEGREPKFDKQGKRIYYLSGGGKNTRFKSRKIDGGDERSHFTSEYATQIVLSPDEKWVAFTELFNAYVAPFARTGGEVKLSAKSKAYPVKKVTRDAGSYLHWSGDSRSLHWTIGPQYFSRDLKDCFTFLPGAPDSLPAIDTTGIDIGLKIKEDIPKGIVAFTNARIITMKGDEVIENGSLVISGNRILAVGSADSVKIPRGAKIIEAQGKTIIPGLVDVHAHLWNSSNGMSPQENWIYDANLAFGVTTAHDPSANTEMVFSQSEMIRAGLLKGPRVFSTGTILYGAEGNFKAVINSLDDARSHLRRMKAVGAFSVKSYNQPRRDQRQQVIQAARELKMMVVPEGGSMFFHNMSMILDGHTGVEHSIPVSPLYKDVVNTWKASQTGYTPTLIVSYGGLWGENYWYQHSNVWENQRLMTFSPRALIDSRSRRRPMAPEEEYGHIENARAAKVLADAGVKVNLGAHGQLQGLGAHWELWMFVQGGMSPLQALQCATINGAWYVGLDEQVGSLEKGKLADLVVLDKNPLDDIQNSQAINMVMKNGRLYDAHSLDQIGNYSAKRGLLYWERGKQNDAFIWKNGRIALPTCSCGSN